MLGAKATLLCCEDGEQRARLLDAVCAGEARDGREVYLLCGGRAPLLRSMPGGHHFDERDQFLRVLVNLRTLQLMGRSLQALVGVDWEGGRDLELARIVDDLAQGPEVECLLGASRASGVLLRFPRPARIEVHQRA